MHRLCGVARYDRQTRGWEVFATATAFQPRAAPRAWHLVGALYIATHDSGGPRGAIRVAGQTGNSGANPGRPRRCIQASRPVASSHCGPPALRAEPREGMRPA